MELEDVIRNKAIQMLQDGADWHDVIHCLMQIVGQCTPFDVEPHCVRSCADPSKCSNRHSLGRGSWHAGPMYVCTYFVEDHRFLEFVPCNAGLRRT